MCKLPGWPLFNVYKYSYGPVLDGAIRRSISIENELAPSETGPYGALYRASWPRRRRGQLRRCAQKAPTGPCPVSWRSDPYSTIFPFFSRLRGNTIALSLTTRLQMKRSLLERTGGPDTAALGCLFLEAMRLPSERRSRFIVYFWEESHDSVGFFSHDSVSFFVAVYDIGLRIRMNVLILGKGLMYEAK